MKERLYAASPVWLQNFACGLAGRRVHQRRYGRGWNEVWRRVRAAGEASAGELEQFRTERLRRQFIAASQASFWAARFAEYGVDPNGSDAFGELAKLPVLTKAEVRANADSIQPLNLTETTIRIQTSGSTGSPLHFSSTRAAHQEQWAVWWRYRNWHGLHLGDWHASFGGKMIVPRAVSSPPFWRLVRPDRRWFFSSYHLSKSTIGSYTDALRRHGLKWLHGYPSALSTLATLAGSDELVRLRLRAVTTGAESLLPMQRELMEARFGCSVRQHYGLAEGVANISECESGILHVDEDFAHVEFVPVDGQSDALSIIGTNLSNPAFPLFRYDTGDIASLRKASSCTCGRPGRLVKSIDGRTDDVVVLKDGTRVSGQLNQLFASLSHIREAQIIQERIGEVKILVAKNDGFDLNGVEAELLSKARSWLSPECDIQIEYVDAVPRTSSGKVRLVVSRMTVPSEGSALNTKDG